MMALRNRSLNRKSVAILTLIGVVLSLGILRVGFVIDDHPQLLALSGEAVGGASPFDLYRFTPNNPEWLSLQQQRGPWPWWTNPELKVAFLRPYASMMLNIDHALFGLHSFGYALHTLFYVVLLLVGTLTLYRRLLPARTAWLAGLLFVIDDLHVSAAAWIASRYTVVAAAFAVASFIAYVRLRQDNWRPGRALSALCFTLSLSCGEIGLTLLAWIFAYEWVLRSEAATSRIRGTLPFLVITTAYLFIHRVTGYGVSGSGLYVNPLAEPLRFIERATVSAPILLGDLFGGLPSDIGLAAPEYTAFLVDYGSLSALLVFALSGWAARRSEGPRKRLIAFLITATIVSMLPTLGAPPGGRVLVLPSITTAALVAVIVETLIEAYRTVGAKVAHDASPAGKAPIVPRFSMACALVALSVIHLIAAPTMAMARTQQLVEIGRHTKQIMQRAKPNLMQVTDVLVIQCGQPLVAIFGPAELAVHNEDFSIKDKSWHTLSLTNRDHRVERVSADTFDLHVLGGTFLDNTFTQVLRDKDDPMRAGYRVETQSFVLQVLKTERGVPTAVRVRLKRPSNDPKLMLARCTEDGLVKATLPAIGNAVTWPSTQAISPALTDR